jgi:hypothetical protein
MCIHFHFRPHQRHRLAHRHVITLQFHVTNRYAQAFAFSSATEVKLQVGRALILGRLTGYQAVGAALDQFVDETESPKIVTVDGTPVDGKYTFRVAGVKSIGASHPVQNEQIGILTLLHVSV